MKIGGFFAFMSTENNRNQRKVTENNRIQPKSATTTF